LRVVELLVVSYVVEGVFGIQILTVLGLEFGGEGIISFRSSREITDSGSKGIRPAVRKPVRTLSGVIEVSNAGINTSKKSSFVI
jgi:hypothetical protein